MSTNAPSTAKTPTADKPKAPAAPSAPKAPAAPVKAAVKPETVSAPPGKVESTKPAVETKTYADGTTATGTAPLPETSPTAIKHVEITGETITDPVDGRVVKKNPTLAELRAEEAAFMAREKEEARLQRARDKENAAHARSLDKLEKQSKKAAEKLEAKQTGANKTAEDRQKKRDEKLKAKQVDREAKAELKAKERAATAEQKLKDAATKRDAKKAERAEEAAKQAETKKAEIEQARAKKASDAEAKQIERFREAAEARRKIAERKKASKIEGGRRPKATHIKLNAEGFSKTQDFSLRGKVHAYMLENYKPGDVIAIDELAEKTKGMLYGLNVRSILNKLDETAHIDFVPLSKSPAPVVDADAPKA